MSYSIKLKYIKFIDLLSISILFSIRILIGGIVVSVPISYELGFLYSYQVLALFPQKIIYSIGQKYSKHKDKNISN